MVSRIDEHDGCQEPVRQMTDEEFFSWIARGLQRRKEANEILGRKAAPGPQLALNYAVAWLLGTAILLALASGVIALAKLLVSLLR